MDFLGLPALRRRFLLVVITAVVVAACSSPRSTALRSEPRSETPPSDTTVPPATASETRAGSEDTAVSSAFCPPPLRLAPRVLAVTWPQHVGRRVAFVSRVLRSSDFTQIVIGAKDGARFAVTLGPDEIWSDESVHAFVVGGSTKIRIHGATTLPLLYLDDDCSISAGAP